MTQLLADMPSSPQTPAWAIWIPIFSAVISIVGSALGSYLSARYFSPTAQSKTLLNTEKLMRYVQGLSALHSYKLYVDEIFDPEQNDFKKAPDEVWSESRKALKRLSELLSEKNFVLSTGSYLVIRDFFYECELEWQFHCRTYEEEEIEAYRATRAAVLKAIDNFVISGRKDMGWPAPGKTPDETIAEIGPAIPFWKKRD